MYDTPSSLAPRAPQCAADRPKRQASFNLNTFKSLDIHHHLDSKLSFGWSAGDIVAGISTLVKVGKALKQSGGAASKYQEAIAFLASVEATLRGLETIVSSNPDLDWKDGLVEQASLLKSAVDDFKRKVDKYDLSLGSESDRRKVRRIPREVQFALSDKVKELRTAITQPQLVLDMFINLQTLSSILDLSKSSSISQDNLQVWTNDMSQVLPTITDALATLKQLVETGMVDVTTCRGSADARMQDYLTQTKAHLEVLGEFQATILTQSAVTIQELRQWQVEFQETVQALCTCTKDQLDLWLKEDRDFSEPVRGSGISPLQIAMSAVQIIASGVASGIGSLTALSLYASSNEEEPKLRLPLQWRHIPSSSMPDPLAPDDARWDEAFRRAAESSRDFTGNRVSTNYGYFPAAPEVLNKNTDDFAKPETHSRNRGDLCNPLTTPQSAGEPGEAPAHQCFKPDSTNSHRGLPNGSCSHIERPRGPETGSDTPKSSTTTKDYRSSWVWTCCQCLECSPYSSMTKNGHNSLCSKCNHSCCDYCPISRSPIESNPGDSMGDQAHSSSPLSGIKVEAMPPDNMPRPPAVVVPTQRYSVVCIARSCTRKFTHAANARRHFRDVHHKSELRQPSMSLYFCLASSCPITEAKIGYSIPDELREHIRLQHSSGPYFYLNASWNEETGYWDIRDHSMQDRETKLAADLTLSLGTQVDSPRCSSLEAGSSQTDEPIPPGKLEKALDLYSVWGNALASETQQRLSLTGESDGGSVTARDMLRRHLGPCSICRHRIGACRVQDYDLYPLLCCWSRNKCGE